MNFKKHGLLALLICLSLGNLLGQDGLRIGPGVTLGDESQVHQLILKDFTRLLGTAMGIDGDELLFQLRYAENTNRFPLEEVRFIGLADQASGTSRPINNSNYIDPPALSDLTYLRTALPTQGKGRVRVIDIAYSIAEFNINENIQLGAGILTPVGPLFTQRLRAGLGKYVNIGIANQSSIILVDPFEGAFLIGELTGNLTIGDEDRLLNLGAGLGYDTSFDETSFTVRIGAGGRISPAWHLYGELAIFEGSRGGISSTFPSISCSYAIRRHRWRFGIFAGFSDNFLSPPLPLVGYDYHW